MLWFGKQHLPMYVCVCVHTHKKTQPDHFFPFCSSQNALGMIQHNQTPLEATEWVLVVII